MMKTGSLKLLQKSVFQAKKIFYEPDLSGDKENVYR